MYRDLSESFQRFIGLKDASLEHGPAQVWKRVRGSWLHGSPRIRLHSSIIGLTPP